jgi:hypothetical protein
MNETKSVIFIECYEEYVAGQENLDEGTREKYIKAGKKAKEYQRKIERKIIDKQPNFNNKKTFKIINDKSKYKHI